MSRFVVVEGVDGAGKSTLVAGLKTALVERGFDVLVTRELGGSPRAEEIRTFLFSPEGAKLSLQEQMELVHEGRLDHINTVIRPAFEAGKMVVCDRFEMSSLVYQVWYEQATLLPVYERLAEEVANALGTVIPQYIFLTLPAEEVQKRQYKSNDINRFDAVEIKAILDRQAAYNYAACKVRGEVSEVDATSDVETVLQEALKKLL